MGCLIACPITVCTHVLFFGGTAGAWGWGLRSVIVAVASVGSVFGIYLSMGPFVTVACFLFLDVVFFWGGGGVVVGGGFSIRMGDVSLI